MKQVSQKLTDRIIKNGNIVSFIKTPKGNMKITELIESRGNSTDYIPKSFKYVSLPGEQNRFFTVTAQMEKHWKEAGFET